MYCFALFLAINSRKSHASSGVAQTGWAAFKIGLLLNLARLSLKLLKRELKGRSIA
jgi:hypothetical protein